MKVKCEYCGGYLSDTDERCPNCGGINPHLMRSAVGVPKTIDELLTFCHSRKMPLEKMRFFIGEDYKLPRAFGIYQDNSGDFIVYKNKADGKRVVRYRGKDEAYAVNELYQKLKSETLQRKDDADGATRKTETSKSGPDRLIRLVIIVLLVGAGIFMMVNLFKSTPNSGYYDYNETAYYNNHSAWYVYDDGVGWMPTTAEDELLNDYAAYWQGYEYGADYEADDFQQSQYANTADSDGKDDDWNDDAWDDDVWDYDYDSWDSGGTDWNSDW